MLPSCAEKHKKPVCTKCDGGTRCTKCCLCKPHQRPGRPRKDRSLPDTPVRINPERSSVHCAVSIVDTTCGKDSPTCSNYGSSQAHILSVFKLMGCDCESSVRRLPCLDIRRQVVYAGNDEIDSPSFCRIENVFLKGMKALVHLLLPNLKLKSDLKNAFILKSVVESNEATSADASLDRDSLVTIPSTISDVLKREKYYTSSDARRLLVTLADVPHADVASLLSISKDYASELMFQAKVDRLYLTHGLRLQEHHKTQSRVHRDVVEFAVEFIYSDDNISRLAWVAKKRSPNRNPRWKELTNMFAMRSLVLKHDIASMYEVYTMKHRDVMPGKPPIGRTLFYTIANHITGGGKVQEARAGVDYVKVNFHIDNFVIVDRLINILAPLSDVDHTLRDELHGLRTNAYDFLSYGYSLHAREGVAASDGTEANSHQPQEHEVKQFRAYQELEEMASAPDLFDDPDTQQAFVDHVKAQLSHCAQATRTVVEQSECSGFSTHSPVFSLDLVPNRKPNRDPKLGGHLECNACRGPFVFYDRLRQVALNKLDEDPTRLDETADVLLTVHQCERRTFRYMAHVMQAAQQSLRMKQAIAEMDSTTAYLIFDFKQKFLAKGFREGGDSYYGKKGMLWWGAGVFIKPYSTEEEVRSGESNEKLHVMIDFSDEKVRLLQQVGVVNEGNDGGVQDVEINENMEGGGYAEEGEADLDGCEEEGEADHDGCEEEGVCDHDGCEEGEGDHDGWEEDGEGAHDGCEEEGEGAHDECEEGVGDHDGCEEGEGAHDGCEEGVGDHNGREEGEGDHDGCEEGEGDHDGCEEGESDNDGCEEGKWDGWEEEGDGSDEEGEKDGCEEEGEGDGCEEGEGDDDEAGEWCYDNEGMQDKAGGCEEVDMGDLQNVNYEWISEDEEEVDDDKGVDEVDLHFIDCVVQNEQKADGNIVLSCLEAALHALRQRFPHVTKLIVQSDNAKNLAGKQTKLLLPYVCSAAGLRLVAYYHNEAQSGKDVCDTHFSHQQSRVEAYLVQGNGGRKVSTPKQLAVALMEKSLSNTTVLLVKPDFKAPYRSKVIPAISGISEYYAAQYATTDGQQHIKFYNCLGQKMPSACVPIPSCHATSLINAMGEEGINFTGVAVLLNSFSESTGVQVRKDKGRYKKRTKGISQREMQRVQKQHEDEEALKRIQAVYPQCTVCLYHFKSQLLLAKHVCSGVMEHQDVLSIAMRYANTLLATMDFTVSGAVDRASNLLTDDSNLTYATFEFNFYAGWAHTRKKMQPELTTRVTRLIHECWKGGENKDLGKVKISADGVFCRLDELQSQKMIRLSELPVAGKIRVVYQTIGRQSEPKLSDRKRGRSQRNETTQGRQKKARMTFEDLKFDKDLSQWKKEELQTYLCHHNIKKTGNKSELVRRITEYMKTLQN
eukprot:Em0016g5a